MEKLYVITPIFNPVGYKSRYTLYFTFEKYLSKFEDIEHYTIELAPQADKFVVTSSYCPRHIQMVGTDPLWYKENLINIAIAQLPKDAKYIAWIDPDVIFSNPNWVKEIINKLKTVPVMQPWSTCIQLDSNNDFMPDRKSSLGLAKALVSDPKFHNDYEIGRSGLAWACTMDWIQAVGGLLDVCICGSGDTYIAHSLIGEVEGKIDPGMSIGWCNALLKFQDRCQCVYPSKTIPYLDNLVIHYYHGSTKNRNFENRWKILRDIGYDPTSHLIKNSSGLYQVNLLQDRSVELKDGLFNYFKSRNEDEK